MGQKSRGQHLELVIWSLWHPTAPWGSLWEERRRGIKLAAMRDPQWQRHQGCPPRSPPQALLVQEGEVSCHQLSDPTEAPPASAGPCYRPGHIWWQ